MSCAGYVIVSTADCTKIVEVSTTNVVNVVTEGPAGAKGETGATGAGVPVGGTTNQILVKNSNNDYDTVWVTSTIQAYIHNQTVASATWTITHNLGFKPSVELFNSGSQEIEGDVVHASYNVTIVYFTQAITGFARLN